jgi:type 1 fimbria pilin
VLTVPLVAAALAWGCTAAAVLSVAPASAPAGATVTVSGKYFGTHDPEDVNSNSPVQIRLGSVSGPVLAQGSPTGPDRAFSVNVKLPAGAAAGDTFLSATQLNSSGQPVYGTPARQAFTVTAPSSSGSATGGGQVLNRVAPQVATLSLATARRLARARVLRAKAGAKRIRTSCVRRSATSAVCRVRYRIGSKGYSKRLVVRSQSSAAAW